MVVERIFAENNLIAIGSELDIHTRSGGRHDSHRARVEVETFQPRVTNFRKYQIIACGTHVSVVGFHSVGKVDLVDRTHIQKLRRS